MVAVKSIKDNTEATVNGSVILAVDDQAINLEILKCCLEDDYQIVCATSGEEALSTARFLSPDLILLDVMLDGISGLDVCKELKQDTSLQDIPVIFVTSNDTPEDESNCWNAGGSDFILKPIKADTLGHRVKTHLTIKHQQDRLRKATYTDRQSGLMNFSYLLDQLDQYYSNPEKKFEFVFLLINFANKEQLFNGIPPEDRGLTAKKINHTLCSLAKSEEDAISKIASNEFAMILHNVDTGNAEAICQSAFVKLYEMLQAFLAKDANVTTPELHIGIVKSDQTEFRSGQEIFDSAISARDQATTKNSLFYVIGQ